jgi:endonuclease YncB( thermonuclease family)
MRSFLVLLAVVGVVAGLGRCFGGERAVGDSGQTSAARNHTDDLVLVGKATRVVDGDTFDVTLDSGSIRVRMWGIDAPEHDQPYGPQATSELRRLVEGHEIQLQPAGQTSYERMVARVFVEGTDIDAEMIKGGFAMAERRYLRQFDDGKSYCVLEQSARSAGSGMWSLPPDKRVAPWEWRRRKTRTTPFTDYGKATTSSCMAEIGKPLSP